MIIDIAHLFASRVGLLSVIYAFAYWVGSKVVMVGFCPSWTFTVCKGLRDFKFLHEDTRELVCGVYHVWVPRRLSKVSTKY